MSSPTKLRQMAKELGWPPELEKAADQLQKLKRENAALRKVLSDSDEIERYNGSDGHRQWGKCSTWLNPDDAVIIVSAKALDAVRKEAQS